MRLLLSLVALASLSACASSAPPPSPPPAAAPTSTSPPPGATETAKAAEPAPTTPVAVAPTATQTAPVAAATTLVACKGTALVLLLDRSGSMTGAPFEATKRAAKAAITALPVGSCVEVAFFDSAVTDLVPLAPVDPSSAAARIDVATPGGGTEFVGALEAGASAMRRVQGATKRRVLFLSDGMAPAQGVLDAVARIRASGATLSTIGLGRDADAALLGKMADGGSGRFYAVMDPASLEKIFVRELAL